MYYSKQTREHYNKDREITCEQLGITVNQYNAFRRLGQRLHKLYEDQCNGFQDAFGNWDEAADKRAEQLEEKLNKQGEEMAGKLGLFIYYQTDPRGATIYLDKTEIPYDNYNKAYCIY